MISHRLVLSYVVVVGVACSTLWAHPPIAGARALINNFSLCDPSDPNACANGKFCRLPNGVCDSADVLGICWPIPLGCPDNIDPVCGCDGVTYFNLCEALANSVSIAHFGPCAQVCGGIAGIPCEDGEFCKLPDGHCCCDFQGICVPIPQVCPDVYDPVCGCDGMTYGNECEASAAGVSVDHNGPCEQVCGGFAGVPCEDKGEFCKLPTGQCCCDFQGVCTPVPEACPAVYDPVCGCDGVTYGNECEADRAGVSVDHVGTCGEVCGGFAGIPCDDKNEFCKLPTGQCCCDQQGECTPIPPVCLPYWDPVCGCDGVTYGNECEADRAGVSVDHVGPCGEVCGGFAGIPCDDKNEFCKLPIGGCCCDFQGECTPYPQGCPDVWDPVCGCDGVTYGNECDADAAGMSVDHVGPCED